MHTEVQMAIIFGTHANTAMQFAIYVD